MISELQQSPFMNMIQRILQMQMRPENLVFPYAMGCYLSYNSEHHVKNLSTVTHLVSRLSSRGRLITTSSGQHDRTFDVEDQAENINSMR